jgi:glycosyltransferase involved in cell wall biosynthesis
MPTVLFAMAWVPTYQVPFYDTLREVLRSRGIETSVVSGLPSDRSRVRGPTTTLDWGTYRRNRFVHAGSRELVWQPAAREAAAADLVIVDEGGRQLLNWWLVAAQARGRAKVAFWGHVGNLNASRAITLAERLKTKVFRLPHWWFAYTPGAKERLVRLGYPATRITVTNNSAAPGALRVAVDAHRAPGEARRSGLFLGSLYSEKRLEFLIDAADEIVARVPGFTLVVAGDGPARDAVARAAATRPYVRVVGRVEGSQKAALLARAAVVLLPGAVGLAAVDGFAAALPTVTTAVQTHGPEIEFVEHGVNGLVLGADATPAEYATAVVSVLEDDRLAATLRDGAAAAGAVYTLEQSVARFAAGIEDALGAPDLRR